MTIFFDKLIDRYIPTHEGWYFHPDNTAQLTTTEEDSKLVIDEVNPLTSVYKQLMFTSTSSSGNSSVYYLDMVATAGGTLPEIVRDLAASNAKAIAIGPDTRMIFRTNYPYNKDRLKKVLCRVRNVDSTAPIQVGVCSIRDAAYVQPDGEYGFEMYPIVVDGAVTSEYVTYVGYLLGTDTLANIGADTRPNNDVDYPAPLLDGTTDIALSIKVGSGTGYYRIDSIELQDTENDITDLPGGTAVVNSLDGLTDDNAISPIEKTYLSALWAEISGTYGDETTVGVYYEGSLAGVLAADLLVLKTKYDALDTLLNDPVTGILITMNSSSTVDGAAFDLAFSDYYSIKAAVMQSTALLNAARITITATSSVITITARGVLQTPTITFAVTTHNIPIENVVVSVMGSGTLTHPSTYNYILDCATVTDDIIQLSATATYLGKTYTTAFTVSKEKSTVYEPYNFGSVTALPLPTELPNGGEVLVGDYLLWAQPNPVPPLVNPYTYGEIYEYDGTGWEPSTNGDLVMTMFDSFADLANDVDSMVMGLAVIKKLVAIDAFIKNLQAQNLKAGTGTGMASSGFRFRAQTDSVEDGTNVPVFDVYYDDNQLFKVDIDTGKIFFGTHFWYDPSDGAIHTTNNKTVINSDGTIEAVDGTFSGNLLSATGRFTGSFTTPTLSSEPGEEAVTTYSAGGGIAQARTMASYMIFTLSQSTGKYIKTEGTFNGKTVIGSVISLSTVHEEGEATISLWPLIKWPYKSTEVTLSIVLTNSDGTTTKITSLKGDFEYNTSTYPVVDIWSGSIDSGTTFSGTLTLDIYTGGDILTIHDLPSSAYGLASGRVWNDGGTLKIV